MPGKRRPRRSDTSRRDERQRPVEFSVVGIGASAGGLEAVSQLLRNLPDDLGMAVVVIQHLDPEHESALPTLLARACRMPVHQATEAMPLQPDCVWVIPSNSGITLKHGSLHLRPRKEMPDPRRPIDLFLRSLAEELRDRSIGVVLSGTGTDGTFGLEAIKAEGGITFAQDATATYDGMPMSATSAGCVDYVLPPEGIANELIRISRHPPLERTPSSTQPQPDGPSVDLFESVVQQLSKMSGVDFSNYKQATIRRRVSRRMVISRIERIEDYLQLLEQDPGEAEGLSQDVLINVTSFFRDTAVFDGLKRKVFPALLRDRPAGRPIRIWVPGCATGEEVYSLAICLLEFLGPRAEDTPIKLFGTDVSEAVISQARSGRYPERIASDVDPGRLRRFFVRDEGGYAICKAVRDLCVFARQDATRDPPFSNLDLISCRNVLIYLGPVLQKRILPFFHYALRDNCFLLLGTSETVGAMDDLFSVVDRQQRIYARRQVPSRLMFDVATGQQASSTRNLGVATLVPPAREVDVIREADRVVLTRCAPPGVLIDERLEILQFRGDTGSFLTPAPGAPSNNLRSMAREGLLPDLIEAVEEAKTQDATVVRQGLSIKSDAGHFEAEIELVPILSPTSPQRCFLVLFHGPRASGDAASIARPSATPEPGTEQRRIAQLERELATAKDYLRASVEEREAANEELRAANEELLSGNEELQSTNEELQTAHEELQATNEELLTVNEELQHRNEEATLLGDDLTNLLSSVEIPIIMLGRDLHIRRFTPSAGKLLNLIPSDLDRSILDLRLKFDVPDLEELLGDVLDTLVSEQREVQDRNGCWHSLCVRPYRSQHDKIDGAVITLTDVDVIKRSEQRLSAARDFAESIVMAIREPLLVLDYQLQLRTANAAFRESFPTVPAGIEVPESDALETGQWQIPDLLEQLEDVRDSGTPFDDFVSEVEIPSLGHRILESNGRRVCGVDDGQPLILLAIEDVTERRRVESENALLANKLQETQRTKSLGILAGGVAHDFNNILTAILGYTNLVQTELQVGSPTLPHLDNIEKGARRAAELCEQMLAYSGRGQLVLRRLDLSEVVGAVKSLLQASVRKKAVLRFELEDELPSVVGDAAQLHQVVMNLVINASEALGRDAGTITVRTGRLRADQRYLESAYLSPEKYAEEFAYLEIVDDGCGMDAETQAQIFDPFFSLKLDGRGLGLAAVIGIVRGHQGALTLDSEPGHGTTFRMLLPTVAGPAEEPTVTTESDVKWRGEGTVLVVDDEGIVRGVLRTMLERLGFRVLEAEHGRAGIEVFTERADQIDLVLLDVTMPHLDGPETFQEIRKLRSDARVVLMSGYDERQSLSSNAPTGIAGFLRKPFLLRDLVTKLRDVLEAE